MVNPLIKVFFRKDLLLDVFSTKMVLKKHAENMLKTFGLFQELNQYCLLLPPGVCRLDYWARKMFAVF